MFKSLKVTHKEQQQTPPTNNSNNHKQQPTTIPTTAKTWQPVDHLRKKMSEEDLDRLRATLRVGVHEEVLWVFLFEGSKAQVA